MGLFDIFKKKKEKTLYDELEEINYLRSPYRIIINKIHKNGST